MAGQGKDPFEGLGQFADSFRKSPYFNPELAQQQKQEEARQQLPQPEQQPQQEVDRTPELSPEDQDLAARIRQVEEETRGQNDLTIRKERVRALLKPRLGGIEPEKLIKVCHILPTTNGFEQHTYYASESGTPTNVNLPDQTVIQPHIAQLFTQEIEPCLQHIIELNIGIAGTIISQKKALPYEVLQQPVKNQLELERLVTAATEEYVLIGKEVLLPFYMKERRRKIAAVVFTNTELYKSQDARQQIAQLLWQIDDGLTLRSEGKISEEEVKALIAKLRPKPTMAAQVAQQQPQLEQKVNDAYLAERFVVPARLNNADEINLVLRMVGMPYEVVLDAPPGFGLFKVTKPGYSSDEAVAKATETIPKLDALITLLRGSRTKEQVRQELQESAQRMYESLNPPQLPQDNGKLSGKPVNRLFL